MSSDAPILALDTASPVVSLALGSAGRVLASRTIELRQSSERLLRQIDEVLTETGWHLGDLRGLVVLQGPGSFTGLRVGLGTALGLHQALGLPATALPTLDILARSAKAEVSDGDTVTAVVDALRGEWMARTFVFEGGEPQPVDEASLRSDAVLVDAG
ncbi:MAG: tRNA (adenosine(37)-N6)-threonylcarbamoyltransferase complex dimerization subunit type 1 TsaB, partial [Acidobacteriota bacterium]